MVLVDKDISDSDNPADGQADWLCVLPGAREIARAGAKATRLAQAARAGLRVPDGFVVAAAGVSALAGGDTALTQRVVAGLDVLSASSVAVRSSSPVEDSPTGSLAGVFTTRLEVGAGELIEAVVDVGYSGPNTDGPIPVLVQSMVTGTCGGVASSCDPVTGGPCAVLEYAAQGPVAVTAGTGPVSSLMVRRRRDGTYDVNPDPGPVAALTVGALSQLRRLFNCEVNIEWIIDQADRFVLLQVRPVVLPVGTDSAPSNPAEMVDPVELVGVALSPGQASGALFRIDTDTPAQHAEPVPAGAVAVAHSLRLDQLPLLADAVGLVVIDPSVLSHVAIRARELGLPAVGGIGPVVTELAEGTMVQLDGTSGVVRAETTARDNEVLPPWHFFDPWALTGIDQGGVRFVIGPATGDGGPCWVFSERPLDPAHRNKVRSILEDFGMTSRLVVFDERTAWLPADNSPSIIFTQYQTWQQINALPRLQAHLTAAIGACDRLDSDELTQIALTVTSAAQRCFQACIETLEAAETGDHHLAELAGIWMAETRLLHGSLLGVGVLDILAARAIDRAHPDDLRREAFVNTVTKLKNQDLTGNDHQGAVLSEYAVIDRFYQTPALRAVAVVYQW